MRPKLSISRVEDILEFLELEMNPASPEQSMDIISEHIRTLCAYLAFANGQMAVAKVELNSALDVFYSQTVLNYPELAPSTRKAMATAKASQQQYDYDICERTARCIVHQIDAFRSVLSALKEEMIIANIPQNS